MQYLIKQRVFSWTDTYDIYDGAGVPRYYVEAEFFRIGHVIHLYDKLNGMEVGVVKQRLLTLLPKFELYTGGQLRAVIHKAFTFFKPRYAIEGPGWQVEGDVFGWNYNISGPQGLVLTIDKQLLSWGDTYHIDIPRPQDELLGLMTVIAIDAANCDN